MAGDKANSGLHGVKGSVELPEPPPPAHPLDRHGPLRLSENRRYLVHADGTPFLWLADTAWNGVMKARDADWERYLTVRREQGFNTIQTVIAHWRAFPEDLLGERAFSGSRRIQVNPDFFRRMDSRIQAIADHGLVPALVQLWALTPEDPGWWLPEADAIRLARYQVARYGHLPVVWILGGDGRYTHEDQGAERWQAIGRGVFGEGTPPHEDPYLVTLHPSGRNWVGEAFREEPWFDLIAYQSGHGSNEQALTWLTQGPPASEWSSRPQLPCINQEPCYEGHKPYHRSEPFQAYDVRRAMYWSLLNAPTAGVTYGHHGVWPWMETRGVPLAHPNSGEAAPWHEAVQADGSRSVTHIRHLFSRMDWWRLEPRPGLLAEQPGSQEVETFVTASASRSGDLAVIYTPAGGRLQVATEPLQSGAPIQLFDPGSGDWLPAGVVPDGDEVMTLMSPEGQDWVYVVGGTRWRR